ncbi:MULTISPECIES: Sca4 family protein [unclassified Candidatus Tisiphia]|uniref:Sca4 family protein n=1 Tax=unclassified Candidatus Tisiphia TaxID=2996318 RepID=UPI00312CB718
MKDNPQLSNILEENITEVIEPTEEAQDLVTLTNSVSSSRFFGIEEELDPITQAIRQEILQKQRNILKDYIAANLDVTVNYHDDQEFAEYLKNVNNRAIINQAFLDSKVKAELERTEIAGYKKIHHNFADRFHTISWQDDDRQDNIRSQIVRNDSGDELATIKETTHKINTLVSLSDGTFKQINNYRTIDLPTELVNKSGPMHLSLAVKDENGRNISLDRAVYFTAHYNSQGKLSEISSPKPVRFNGEGDEAIGYIEHLGHVYSLPVTQGKYREMMLALEKNKGQEIDLSQQNITTAQDMIVTVNTVNSDLLVQEEKKQYHHDKQKLTEETLQKTAEHHELAKRQAESISQGMQLTEKSDNVANRQLFEKMSKDSQYIHDMSPEQAILNELQPLTSSREKERKALYEFAELYPDLTGKLVARHYDTHAVVYHKEKTADASSTALEELENLVKICGGHKKLGLTSVEKQLPELDKIRRQGEKDVDKVMTKIEEADKSFYEKLKKIQLSADKLPESNPDKEKLNIFVKLKLEAQESINTSKPPLESKKIDESLKMETETTKKVDRMIGRFMSKYSPSNTPPPLNRSKLQLNNTKGR